MIKSLVTQNLRVQRKHYALPGLTGGIWGGVGLVGADI